MLQCCGSTPATECFIYLCLQALDYSGLGVVLNDRTKPVAGEKFTRQGVDRSEWPVAPANVLFVAYCDRGV